MTAADLNRKIPLVISFLSLVFSPVIFAQEEVPQDVSSPAVPFVGLVTADGVNIRATPRISAEILSQLSKGSKVEVLEKKGAWYGVRLPSESSVYVAKGFLRIEGEEAQVTGKHVHVRAGAGVAFTSLGVLPEGTRLKIRRTGETWAQVAPPGQCRGWIHEKYITFLQSVGAAP